MLAVLLLLAGQTGGPVKVHAANPRYLEWRGRPMVLVTSAEHYGAVLNPDFNYVKYLDTLKADGMTYTRIFSGSYVEPAGAFGIERNTLAPAAGKFLAPWARSDQPGYAGGGNKFDLGKWDAEYLKRLKAFLTAAAERDIVVELTLFCSTYGPKQWAVSPFNPGNTVTPLPGADWKTLHTPAAGPAVIEQQVRLAKYLAVELNGFDNLVYEVQNEPWADHHTWGETINEYVRDKTSFPNRVEVTARESVAWQAKVVAAVREAEASRPKKHLVFQNVANFRLAINPALDLAAADAVHFHYAHPEAAEWNAALKLPVGCDETGFAGKDDATYRRQAWAFVMAGGALWNHLDYSFAVGKEDGTDVQPNSPGGGGPALRKQLRVLGEFVNRLDLSNARPTPEAVASAPGCAARCLAVAGKQYAVYLRGRGPMALTLSVPGGKWRAEWVDVATGASRRTDRAEATNGILMLPAAKVADEAAVWVTADR